MKSHAAATILATVTALTGTAAPAAPLEVRETLAASANLPGVQNSLDFVWKGRRVSAGFAHALTPSYGRLGGWVQVSAGPAFDLRAGIEPTLYHGASGSLLGFSSREAAFDEDTRRNRRDARARAGGRAYLAPTVRARAGALVASIGAELEWWVAGTDEKYFYEPSRDTLLRSSGESVLRTSTAVLYERTGAAGSRLLAGVNHRLTHVSAGPGQRIFMQRAGLLASWTLGDRRFGLREPTLVASVFRYLEDPYKKGEIGLNLALRCRLR